MDILTILTLRKDFFFLISHLVEESSSSISSDTSYMFFTISSLPIRRKSPMEVSIPHAIWQKVLLALMNTQQLDCCYPTVHYLASPPGM